VIRKLLNALLSKDMGRRGQPLRAEAAALSADPSDRAEAMEVAALMRGLAPAERP
jgi:hypothetical protein